MLCVSEAFKSLKIIHIQESLLMKETKEKENRLPDGEYRVKMENKEGYYWKNNKK